jgi:hypothetical protein
MILRLAPLLLLTAVLGGCNPFADTGELLDGVNRLSHEAAADTVRQRLALRDFAPGRPERLLPDYLRVQGFDVRRVDTSAVPGLPIYGEATYGSGIACTRGTSVHWRADRQGIIGTLDVLTTDTCF